MSVKMDGRFKAVQLLKKEVIGFGSYGMVCKAQCDELTCAAKIIHATLVVVNSTFPMKKSPQGRFWSECEFLSSLRHPNVVQYLGTWEDQENGLPVLLMELMDQSLTKFLESSIKPLPFHTQAIICHDISLALSFLHSNGIIHRDLSSNNVLMIGDRRAKVTDFGMAKLLDTSKASLSVCPGTVVYMPPEAVKEDPTYTEKLDCFSIGVVMIQVMSRRYPSPGSRTKNVMIGGRELLERQTELSRREADLKLVDANNRLLPIACGCLKDSAEERPSAKELCGQIRPLREEAMKDGIPCSSIPCSSQSDEGVVLLRKEVSMLRASNRERDEKITSLLDSLRGKEAVIEIKSAKIKDLEGSLDAAQKQNMVLTKTASWIIDDVSSSDVCYSSGEPTITLDVPERRCGMDGTLSTITQDTENFGTPPTITQYTDKRRGTFPPDRDILEWRHGTDAPCPMNRSADAVLCGSIVYVLPDTDQDLCVYNWEKDSWTQLIQCPTNYCTLANVKNSLVVIGGFYKTGVKTNKLFNLSTANSYYAWLETYPPMPTKRDSATAVCYGSYLVVAGGIEISYLRTVEVLQVESKQWHTAASLPSDMFSGSAAICGDRVYILGGWVALGTITYSVITCSLRELVKSCREPSQHDGVSATAGDKDVWKFSTLLPVTKSTCISFQNQLLAIGGQDKNGDPTNKIWMYETVAKSWVEFGECEVARSQCYAAVLPGNQLMVAGGFTRRQFTGETNKTEICKIRFA